MLMTTGHNPMRWNCQNNGCFNLKRRPKIEVFHDLFPGKISMGDVDGIVEIDGNALILEWKSDRNDLPRGQQILYRRLTMSSPLSVLVLVGDAETMNVSAMGWFHMGAYQPTTEATLETARGAIADWVVFAKSHPVPYNYTYARAAC